MRAPPRERENLLQPGGGFRDWPWVALLVLFSAVLSFWPLLWGKTIVAHPRSADIGNQWLGFAAFLRNIYLAGYFPLWDPHDFCGMPFLAFSHTNSLYLPCLGNHPSMSY